VAIAVVARVADATRASAAIWIGDTLRMSAAHTLSFYTLVRSNAVALRVHSIAFVAVAAFEPAVCVDALLVIDSTLVVRPGTLINILAVQPSKALVALDARV
jgi:hypothetical protein